MYAVQEQRADWSALTPAEAGILMDEARRAINLGGKHPAAQAWRELTDAEREVFVSAAIAEMERVGVVQQVAVNRFSWTDGERRTPRQEGRTEAGRVAGEVRRELERVGDPNLFGVVSSDGKAQVFRRPVLYYEESKLKDSRR